MNDQDFSGRTAQPERYINRCVLRNLCVSILQKVEYDAIRYKAEHSDIDLCCHMSDRSAAEFLLS